jgi:L-cysteine:1D-myo-inositol 2-amino-2-deoxy-alpha-D-glucopyranoside ligase
VHLFDTLRGGTYELAIPPAAERPISLYVCGVTPYDTTHIGHAHTFLIFDVLIRYVRFRGGVVRYVRNVTDVDDPLFERALRDGRNWKELAESETDKFHRDCVALNMIPPDHVPRVSEEIDAMLPIIEDLVRKEYAYVSGGSVYFHVGRWPQYGEMVRDRLPNYDALLADANDHGNVGDDPNKQDPLDFVLWRPSNAGEPAWESPWGSGRPGWHIECTAMATHYLGSQIDIHGGGRDLTFPHHPSEIAQTEAHTGASPFARFWVHGGLAFLDGEKMSKSLGNLVLIRDALRRHSANALRWHLLSFPYRDDFNYVTSEVVATEAKAARLRDAMHAESGSGAALDLSGEHTRALALIDDDLQTDKVLPIVESMSAEILSAAAAGRSVETAQQQLRDVADVLGFQLTSAWPL